jgi:hypothetical protein
MIALGNMIREREKKSLFSLSQINFLCTVFVEIAD